MFKKKILVLLSSLMLVSSFGIPVLAEENPYREKVLSVNTLYDVGEANLTANDIVQVNGIDCYVLQVDEVNNKAELITKGIYDVRFDEDGSTYKYHESSLKTWMDDFYTNQLGEDPYILESNVTSYYGDSLLMNFDTCSTESLTQHVFALDGKEAHTNKPKFSWDKSIGFIDNPSANANGFWISAGYSYPSMFVVTHSGQANKESVNGTDISTGARPAFWLDIFELLDTKDTNISYDVTEGYEWSVPSKIEFTSTLFENVNATGNDSQVKITKNVIKEGGKLVISVDDSNDFKLSESTGHELAYQVFADNSELSIGGEVLSLNAGEHCDDAQVDITATLTKDANEIAGEYSDTLIFVAGIEYAAGLYKNGEMYKALTLADCGKDASKVANLITQAATEVVLPKRVTSIGEYAFSECENIKSITIPEGVTSIGKNAFSGCFMLESVTIPSSVTSIGECAFSDCSNLKSVTIPEGVTLIDKYVFSNCYSLKSITIPEGVTSIIGNSFFGCRNLESVTIPDSVTSIGGNAFFGCTSLKSVTIPDTVTSIGNGAFQEVPNIIYSGTATGSPWGAKAVNSYVEGDYVYADSTKTTLIAYAGTATDIIIPNTVTSIGDNAFYMLIDLESVTIPDSVTSIGGNAFGYCTSLTSINIPDGVTSIGEWAFFAVTVPITIPSSVTSIGNLAFANVPHIYYSGTATGSPWGAKAIN